MAQEKAQTQTVSGRPNISFRPHRRPAQEHADGHAQRPRSLAGDGHHLRQRLRHAVAVLPEQVSPSCAASTRTTPASRQTARRTEGPGSQANSGKESATIATRLRSSGYDTGIVGKYMNGYDASWTPPGWSYTYLRADPNTPGALVREDGVAKDASGDPLSSVERAQERALAYLDRRTDQAAGGPFALFFWTGQPHLPAGNYSPRYENLFQDAQVPRTPAFDEADVSDKPQWIRNTPASPTRRRTRWTTGVGTRCAPASR